MSLARKVAIIMCAVLPLLAAPNLTTIQDTIYKANGTRFNGTAVISWMPFDASDQSVIGLQSLTVQITNGTFRVQLVPNADATPVNTYTVLYSSDGKQQFTEMWSVPPSTVPLHIKDVRVLSPSGTSTGGGVIQPPSQSPINESSVIGLLTDLSLRPVRGSSYTTGRAAVVNDAGALDGASGNLADCVRVDGSSGPCGDPSQYPSFVDCETPGGLVDGTNAVFTLATAPDPVASLSLLRNGLAQHPGMDFNIQPDGSILFVDAAVPQPGDVLLASYRTANTSIAEVVVPADIQMPKVQILCSNSGAGTTSANNSLLGSCTIPAHTLAIGDRVEVRFNLGHQGTAGGFTFQVRWGQATMVLRSAAAQDTVITGHGDVSIGPSGTTLDMQTWGTQLALDSRVASASDALNTDIRVDFLAAVSHSGTDTVTLQNYTVLRYPAQ